MNILTRKDFCKLTGLKSKHFTTYLKRGKIVQENNGSFDIKNEINLLFLGKREIDLQKYFNDKNLENTKKSNIPAPTIASEESKIINKTENLEDQTLLEIERQRKIEQIKNLIVDTLLKEQKVLKIKGELIPKEVVLNLVKLINDINIKRFHQTANGFINLIGQKNNLNSSLIIDIRKKLIKEINRSSRDAMRMILIKLENITEIH